MKEPENFSETSCLGSWEGTINRENKNREGIDSVKQMFPEGLFISTTIICFGGFLESIDSAVTVSIWKVRACMPITDSRGKVVSALKP